jgi:hypothetical protein
LRGVLEPTFVCLLICLFGREAGLEGFEELKCSVVGDDLFERYIEKIQDEGIKQNEIFSQKLYLT